MAVQWGNRFQWGEREGMSEWVGRGCDEGK